MQRISTFLFDRSPRELAFYFILGPMLLFFTYTLFSIGYSYVTGNEATGHTLPNIFIALFLVCLSPIVLGILFWFTSVVFSAETSNLGLPRQGFIIALAVFLIYLVYQISGPLIQTVPEDYKYIFYALNEFTAFGGILIAYPIICHYTARAIVVKKKNKPVNFINALPYTLVLIFGTILSIPFFHGYFSNKASTNKQLIGIYVIAFGLFVFLLIIGFIASIIGLI